MKEFLQNIFEILKIALLAVLIVLPVRYFIFQPFVVKGISMEPSFATGDYLIIDELSYRFRDPQRGEVIVFRYPQNPSERFIKRIIALPGETVWVRKGKIEVISSSGEKLTFPGETFVEKDFSIHLKSDEYFVVGDNRAHSFDSRNWGPLKRKYIIGRVLLRLFPPLRIKLYLNPAL